jgi:hypothetical protein
MSEKVGETVRDSADYRCERCHQTLRMGQGALIQPCPPMRLRHIRHRQSALQHRDGSLGPREPG